MIYVLVYNLVRAAMVRAAARQGQPDANRASFIDALRWLCVELVCNSRQAAGCWPLDLVINPIRPGRYHPRARKRRPTEYDLLNKPRSEYLQQEQTREVTI